MMDFDSLSLDSREAMRTAALLGEQFSLPLLVEIGVEAAALDPLFDEGVLIEAGATEARFADWSVADREIQSMPWSRKRRLSSRIADVLEKRDGDSGLIARHCLNAQEFARARSFFTRAAERAILENDYREALSHLRQAFELWPVAEEVELRKRVLREMGRCARNVNDLANCRIAWEELLEMASKDGDLRTCLEANRRLAELASEKPDRLEMRQRLQEAARLSSSLGEPQEEAKNWYAYAGFLLDTLRLADATNASGRALEAAERSGDRALQVEILALNALSYAMRGNADEAYSRIEKSVTLAIDSELPEQIAIAYRRMANINEYSGKYREYRDLELESLDRCRAGGWDGLEQSCLSCVSFAFFRLGQWKQSADAVREAVEMKKIDGELLAVAVTVKGCLAAFRGQRKQANVALDEARRLIQRHGGVVVEFYIYWAIGVLAEFDGDSERAREAYRNLIALWRETDDRKDAVPGMVAAALFYSDSNDGPALAECIDILSAIASDNSTLESNAARAAAMAEDCWRRGKVNEAIELEQQAVESYWKQGLPVERALLLRRLGTMFASKNDQTEADRAWTESMKIARELGMRPLVDALGRDQSASGSNAPVSGLTPRQRDVLRLIATGLTNKEAAAELSLSPRTVEMHVASILERLNCRARTDAIKKATELGLL